METTSLIQQLYVAYYGRPADPGGLDYWVGRLAENGGNLGEVISAFATSDEFEDRFGSLTEEELVNNMYQQILGRPAEPEGLEFYVGMLARGDSSLIELALDITNGAGGTDAITIQNRVEVANKFTQDLAERGLDYGTIEAAGQLVAGVTSETNVAEYIQSAVNQLLDTLPAADQAGPGEDEAEEEAPSTGGGSTGPTAPVDRVITLQPLAEGEERTYTTGSGDDQFIAEDPLALGNGLTINAGAGWDSLVAKVDTLSEYPGSYLMPTLNSIEGVFLEPVAAEEGEGASILLTRAPDVELVANIFAQSNLTVTDVQNQVDLSVIYTESESPRDFAVRYAEKVEHDGVQFINLNNADLNLLTITRLDFVEDVGYQSVSAGISELDIFLYQNDSSIASFTESSGGEFNLSDSIGLITLNGWANLSLGEVWGGLTVDMSNLKGSGQGDIDLDLSTASIGSGEVVTVKVAEFDSEANNKSDLDEIFKSDQAIKLPDLAEIKGMLVIENFTIATGSREDAVVNDVLDFGASHAVDFGDVTVSSGVDGYTTLTVGVGEGEIVLENVISTAVFDAFLSIDDHEDDLGDINIDDDGALSEAGVTALIGLMVHEGTFTGIDMLGGQP